MAAKGIIGLWRTDSPHFHRPRHGRFDPAKDAANRAKHNLPRVFATGFLRTTII